MEPTFESVLDEYTPMIHHIIKTLNIYKDKDRYVHEATIALWEAFCSQDCSKGSFTSYAYSSMRGKLLNHLKKEVRWENTHTFVDELPETLSDFFIPTVSNLEEYTCYLTDKQKKWVVECIVKGKKLEEVAVQEGVTVSAVKSWRAEALKKLRREISK
ncbi:sigma-70 family RNA polymerase sigma factor [Bacillus sp. RO1]|uniref:sigma-70 family RNA polymerase sigma factor n=1 Tax=Bacillus sp. RO1 TaxID=2722703 RepID=UPI001456E51D|nr:sigma-70 family RNA polymerase sigma factor [Bacillus sp. RO1]NLP50669.1 sigma-70 family RNA polymerase sigma factor [Bacillus sp. RO1]